jgi:pyruvate-ferredoxin/flavodoxin oxidoreductase
VTHVLIDGNEAAARVAYALSEVVALYPITPASPMGEHADVWSAAGRTNLWGAVPHVVELQSEGGAAGALHGALQQGSLATTFTASQGLLLMLPNMFKIAGELTPAVVHVAARSIATHALSIFGDHSDVMAARGTGWAMLASSTPQEAHDLAAVAHATTLATRVPFLHFFDGFRTSHELNGVDLLDDEVLRDLVDETDVLAHRARGLTPEAPVLRGSAQNPDVFFQAREASNTFHAAVPAVVEEVMARLGELTGRRYRPVERHGAPDAERVLVCMGSGSWAARAAVDALVARGEKVALLDVRLYRPFPVEAFLAALPDTVQRIAVLDRTKEPGAPAEPLHLDVLAALAGAVFDGRLDHLPLVTGGRYGLSSKEFTPAMAAGVLAELASDAPRARFTVGIVDDVTQLSVRPDDSIEVRRSEGDLDAVFVGLGSDGTVGANKATAKIVEEHTDRHVQGYFVYDSKKSGAMTVSHLRFSRAPVRATWLVDRADLLAVHQWSFLARQDLLARVRDGGTVLLNSPFHPDEVVGLLPVEAQRHVVERGLELWVVDANTVAGEHGLGGRINTVMQACFFALTDLLPGDEAREAMRGSVEAAYGRRGPELVERNHAAIDGALAALHRVEPPAVVSGDLHVSVPAASVEDDFVRRVTARILAGEGDLLPVSALPVDGTFPTGTARHEQRSIALELPVWDERLCIDCGKCAIVCPHAAIRMKAYPADALTGAPDGFLSKDHHSRDLTDHRLTIQVAPDDCTGCGVCVEACPALDKEQVGHRAIDMAPAAEHRTVERARWDFFRDIPELDRTSVDAGSVRGSQLLLPLFEFSGACAGCGETPYLKLLTQLFGDRAVIANATGCSSIYGGNLPTTPWSTGPDGRGPAWINSLFEDNAELGLGLRVGLDQQVTTVGGLLADGAAVLGPELVAAALGADQSDETGIQEQRDRVARLHERVAELLDAPSPGLDARVLRQLDSLLDVLVRRDVWIVGGDGWAYDIGFGGLDHVLASGLDVNVLVLDTEVYSNTGGQASKATPRGAVAKFATAGKPGPKKDLGMLATQYGDVYVAQVAIGANDMQTVRAFREAEAWHGPSLILAYSTCIAHGVDMRHSMDRMKVAVESGYWPLYRYQPGSDEHETPFRLDSRPPTRPVEEFMRGEARFSMLRRSDPSRALELTRLAQQDVDERWHLYEQLAGLERHQPAGLDAEALHTEHATVVPGDERRT